MNNKRQNIILIILTTITILFACSCQTEREYAYIYDLEGKPILSMVNDTLKETNGNIVYITEPILYEEKTVYIKKIPVNK